MKSPFISTARAAETIGIHPNTLRWYEAEGLLPPVPRTGSGYRIFSPKLVLLGRIIHLCHRVSWMTGPVRTMSFRIMRLCKEDHPEEALQTADQILDHLKQERDLADRALEVIRRWHRGGLSFPDGNRSALTRIKAAAAETGLSPDQIRNWERNGLVILPRDPRSRYRVFGREDLERLLVIRFCRRAGYSLTAIRRILHTADHRLGKNLPDLKKIADTPSPEEAALFDPFPTDTLPSTLEGCIDAVETLKGEISGLAGSIPCSQA